MRRTLRLTGLLVSVLALSFTSTACGGGGGGGGGGSGELEVLTFQPSTLFSHEDNAVRVLGTGLGAWQDDAMIRLTAVSGTPFNGGTSATIEFPATVDSSQQMRAVLPATLVSQEVDAYVTVVTASGSEYTTDSAVAHLLAQRIDSITPATTEGSDPAGILDPEPFTISGEGFGPVGSGVTVKFRDPTGQRFRGGSTTFVTVSALIESATTITGRLPVAQVSETMSAFIEYQTEAGHTVSSDAPIITFEPTPSFVSITPTDVFATATPSFTITGTRLTPGSALLTFTAVTGAPFNGGTSRTLTTTGTAISDTEIVGLMPDAVSLSESIPTRLLVSVGGRFIGSGTETAVTFHPRPLVTGINPTTIESGNPSPFRRAGPAKTFTFTGEGLPLDSDVNITFTADGGISPFNENTMNSATATGTVTAVDEITVTDMPDVLLNLGLPTNGTITASVDIYVVDSTTSDQMPAGTVTFVQKAASFVAPFYTSSTTRSLSGMYIYNGSSKGGQSQYSSARTGDVSFGSSFGTFPYYGSDFDGVRWTGMGYGDLITGAPANPSYSNTVFSDQSPTSGELSGKDRIAPMWADQCVLGYLSASGGYSYYTYPYMYYDGANNSVAFRHFSYGASTPTASPYQSNITVVSSTARSYYQTKFFTNGRIDFIYYSNNGMTNSRICGISHASATSANPTDFSDSSITSAGNSDSSEYTFESLNGSGDFESYDWIVFYPDGMGGMDWAKGDL